MSNEHKRAVTFCHRLSTVLAVLCIISQPLLMQIFIDAQHQSWVHREAYDFPLACIQCVEEQTRGSAGRQKDSDRKRDRATAFEMA